MNAARNQRGSRGSSGAADTAGALGGPGARGVSGAAGVPDAPGVSGAAGVPGALGGVGNSRAPEPARRERTWPWLIVAITGSLLSLALFALLLLPPLLSVSEVEIAEGSQHFEIGSTYEVTPPDEWSVQPAAGVGLRASGQIVLRPSGGLLLQSPDRLFTIELRAVSGDEEFGVAVTGQVLTEALENGAELSYGRELVDDHFVALLRIDGADGQVLVRARASDSVTFDAYRAEFAQLLQLIRLTA